MLLIIIFSLKRAYVSRWAPPGPLPDQSAFVLDARDSIPQRRNTTTTTNIRSMRGRGKGRAAQPHPDELGTNAVRVRKRGRSGGSGTTSGRGKGGKDGEPRGGQKEKLHLIHPTGLCLMMMEPTQEGDRWRVIDEYRLASPATTSEINFSTLVGYSKWKV